VAPPPSAEKLLQTKKKNPKTYEEIRDRVLEELKQERKSP